jgi:hypothetical protein
LTLLDPQLEALQRSLAEAGKAAAEADKRAEAFARQLEDAKKRREAMRSAASERETTGRRCVESVDAGALVTLGGWQLSLDNLHPVPCLPFSGG